MDRQHRVERRAEPARPQVELVRLALLARPAPVIEVAGLADPAVEDDRRLDGPRGRRVVFAQVVQLQKEAVGPLLAELQDVREFRRLFRGQQ